MGLTHVAVLGAAIVTLLALPRAVFALGRPNLGRPNLGRRDWAHRPLEETQALHALDRAMQTCGEVMNQNQPPAPALDEIASDLRRLDRQRRGGPTLESERWLAAVVQAYDDRLCLACRCVGVSEHLEPLGGMDREIERVRVEGALQAAGVALRA